VQNLPKFAPRMFGVVARLLLVRLVVPRKKIKRRLKKIRECFRVLY
jgi:hypothetical protein